MSDTYDLEAPPWIDDVSRHPLVTPRVKEIATRLFARLASGEFPFGTRIPAERDLAEAFGDSRATIRQALDFLSRLRDCLPAAQAAARSFPINGSGARVTAAQGILRRRVSLSISSPRRRRRLR